MIDLERLSRRLHNWRLRGYVPVRIWLTTADWIGLLNAAGVPHAAAAPVRRLSGVPITVMDVGVSRVVLEDGSALDWGLCCG